MTETVYLDNNATTAIDPRVLDVLIEELRARPGNPSSTHAWGREAYAKLYRARCDIAAYLKVDPEEIVFTSGGTEGANYLIRGLNLPKRSQLITSNVEHACVRATLKSLAKSGHCLSYLDVGERGAPTLDSIQAHIGSNTKALILMAVNNETGVKSDLHGIASIAQAASIPLIVDGVALLGKEKFDIPLGVSAMFFSGHKIHAPKGTGFVYVRRSFSLTPLITGGDQELRRRAGTENLPGIVAMAKAVRLLEEELPEATDRMQRLRNKLEHALLENIPGSKRYGTGERICNTLNIFLPHHEGEILMARLDLAGLCVSRGSACASGGSLPSHTLLNMGVMPQEAGAGFRYSLSRFTTEDEIDRAIRITCDTTLRRCC